MGRRESFLNHGEGECELSCLCPCMYVSYCPLLHWITPSQQPATSILLRQLHHTRAFGAGETPSLLPVRQSESHSASRWAYRGASGRLQLSGRGLEQRFCSGVWRACRSNPKLAWTQAVFTITLAEGRDCEPIHESWKPVVRAAAMPLESWRTRKV